MKIFAAVSKLYYHYHYTLISSVAKPKQETQCKARTNVRFSIYKIKMSVSFFEIQIDRNYDIKKLTKQVK